MHDNNDSQKLILWLTMYVPFSQVSLRSLSTSLTSTKSDNVNIYNSGQIGQMGESIQPNVNVLNFGKNKQQSNYLHGSWEGH